MGRSPPTPKKSLRTVSPSFPLVPSPKQTSSLSRVSISHRANFFLKRCFHRPWPAAGRRRRRRRCLRGCPPPQTKVSEGHPSLSLSLYNTQSFPFSSSPTTSASSGLSRITTDKRMETRLSFKISALCCASGDDFPTPHFV